jgi:murein DD-endopeptidase MepM/ murein hydrolase activator NlpD/outer membrane biosynthesis protein TonB
MRPRPLLIAVLTALAGLALPVVPAAAQDAPAAAQCVSAAGQLVAAPQGTADGAACPAGWPAPAEPAPPAEPPAPATPAPAEPAPTPAPAPAPAAESPPATAPVTAEPVAGTPETQAPEADEPTSKAKPRSKVDGKRDGERRKRVRDRRRSGGERSTGPDDRSPPPPPASLLRDGPGIGGDPLPPSAPGAPAVPGSFDGGGLGPITLPGPATRGVPNILLDRFRVPPFLLPIYQAAGVEYGVRWEILAAINAIETDYGRNLSVSSAGALGWMQFMPGTWAMYGVDANNDGRRDPYNPVDAIFAAARYLKAAGAGESLRRALWAYNHADWYVNDVLERARALSALPPEVVGSLSGLTLGRFPVASTSTYAGRLPTKGAAARLRGGNASIPVEGSATRRGMRIYAAPGAPVVAVQDAKVVSMGTSERLGRYIRLRDAYGNTYTYGHLAKIASLYPVPRPRSQSEASIRRELGLGGRDPKPTAPATRGKAGTLTADDGATPEPEVTIGGRPAREAAIRRIRVALGLALPDLARDRRDTGETVASPALPGTGTLGPISVPRLPALHPQIGTPLPVAAPAPAPAAAAPDDLTIPVPEGVTAFKAYFSEPRELDRDEMVLRPLRRGAQVIGGTVLGRVGAASLRFAASREPGDVRAARATATRLRAERAPHLYFEVRPAGARTPRIDPKPLLDGWRLLDSTAIYRARNPLVRGNGKPRRLSIGQIMLMSKEQLMRRVLDNPDIEIYACGRTDIRSGIVDRRVLASLELLAARNLKPTVTSLRCGHGYFTASGNVSHHTTGTAVDIAAINGIPMVGNQGPGSITDKAVRVLLTMQGAMKPAQIITLMEYAGTDNTIAMGDHHDHIHVGWRPNGDSRSVLAPEQWDRLVSGLARIRNPVVPVQPSRWAIKVTKKPSKVRHGHSQSHDHEGHTHGRGRARDG